MISSCSEGYLLPVVKTKNCDCICLKYGTQTKSVGPPANVATEARERCAVVGTSLSGAVVTGHSSHTSLRLLTHGGAIQT